MFEQCDTETYKQVMNSTFASNLPSSTMSQWSDLAESFNKKHLSPQFSNNWWLSLFLNMFCDVEVEVAIWQMVSVIYNSKEKALFLM